MKKSYLMIAAAATLFAACTNDEIRNGTLEYGDSEIGFSTYISSQTKAADNNKDAENLWDLEDHHTSFDVWAWKKYNGSWVSTAVYNKGTVNYASSAWTANPLKFWDKSADSYYFYAAAPSDEKWTLKDNATTSNYGDDYLIYKNFKLTGTNIDTTIYMQSFSSVSDVDLMIAEDNSVPRSAYNKVSPDAVNEKFDHILSRLNVTVSIKAGGTIDGLNSDEDPTNDVIVHVTGFTITGSGITNTLKNKGSFNENADLGDDVLKNGTTMRWGSFGDGDVFTSNELTQDGTYNLIGKDISDTIIKNPSDTPYIAQYLIIPQKITSEVLDRATPKTIGGDAASHPYFQLSYTINDEPYTAYYNLANAFNKAAGSTLDFNEGWQNTLHIKIDADIITFDPQVYEWTNAANESLYVE